MKRVSYAIVIILIAGLLPAAAQKVTQMNKTKILSYNEIWQENYSNYKPDNALLEDLKERLDKSIRIEVYLGLWCGDSERNVPEFIKLFDLVKRDIAISYYDCGRKANRSVKFYYENKNVERVPTFIFYRGDKEIGRIVENPDSSLLEDILEILFQ